MPIQTRLFIADLTHLDCAYLDPDHGLMGESWRVDAELGGELGQDGMLCDFGVIKQAIKQVLDSQIDHRLLLLPEQQQHVHQSAGQRELDWQSRQGDRYRYRAPEDAFALLETPSLNQLANQLQALARAVLPDNIQHVQLQLSPAHEQGPYRYCHGLRQHAGNCQRMAHGHRASLEIRLDGERNSTLEKQWQQNFEGRYIGSASDLQRQDAQRSCFVYTGSQGEFELELPNARSCVIDAEPTIEHITAYICREILRNHKGHHVECRAFEGIGKGAISCGP